MAARHRRAGSAQGPRGEGAGAQVGIATFLIDNSALQRMAQPEVAKAVGELNQAGALGTCLPLMLEAGYSARSARDHERIIDLFGTWKVLTAPSDLNERAIMLQHQLFDAGMGRAAGAFDIEVAAYALSYTLSAQPVAIVHYDEDYDHLQDVEPRLLTRWVVPRGSVD